MKTRFKLGGLVLAAVALGALLLASCSSAAPTAPAQPAGPAKPDGSLKLGMFFFTGVMFSSTCDFVNMGDTFRTLDAGVFDTLITLDPEGKVTPGIAERWEIAPDGKSHTFYIRKGVKFHNGDDLTGADVKFSLGLLMNPKCATGGESAQWVSLVDRIDLKDDYTVVVNLKQPLFDLMPGIENLSGSVAVFPKKYVEEKGFDYFRKNPIGSGPWKVLNFQTDIRQDLEALDSHWRAVPKYKNISLLMVPEEGTKVAMLKTGELDMAEVSPESAAGLQTSGLRIYKHYGAAQYFAWVWWDMDNPQKFAFSDPKVRKALSYAINRKEMADKMYGGFAEPSIQMYAPKTAYYYDPNIHKPDPYEPDQAKKLLAEGGYANGFSTKWWDVRPGTQLSNLNLAVVGYWNKIGVNTDLVPTDYAAFSRRGFKPIPDLWNTVFSNLSGGGVFHFERFFTPHHSGARGTPQNHYNTKLNELIDKVPLTADPAEKKKLASQALTLAIEERSTIALLDLYTIYALGKNIGEITPLKGSVGQGRTLELITHPKK